MSHADRLVLLWPLRDGVVTAAVVHIDHIPEDLRSEARWFVYKLVPKPDGKYDKVPCDPNTGDIAETNDPATAASFDVAWAAYQTDRDYHGVGALMLDSEFVGVDLDACILPDGEIEAWALDILNRVRSYSEVTPSGKGIRIITRGTLPDGRRQIKYEGGREILLKDKGFVTITGDRLDDYPTQIHDRMDVLAELHAELFPATETNSAPGGTSRLSDDDLLRLAMQHDKSGKFTRLWSGNWSGYESQSEADEALCMKLAFWSNRDPAQIERLFSQSKLADRDKWDRQDYRERTIAYALDHTTETYQPNDEATIIRPNGVADEVEKKVELPPLPDLLEEVAGFVARYVVLTDEQRDTIALWVAHTHVFDDADQTPYLTITSPEKRSGKTRLLECLELVVARPWFTGRTTAAALVRKVDAVTPTLLLDESDTAFKSDKEYSETLRGVLNSGHRRGGAYTACVGQGANLTFKDFSTFSPKAIAGIGKLPDTVTDRSIPIELKRKRPADAVERFRRKQAQASVADVSEGLSSWGDSTNLSDAEPDLPDELDDRAQDGWEPLLAIADLAGGDWSQRARSAAKKLSAGVEDDSLGVKLLADLRKLFGQQDRLTTSAILRSLNAIDDAAWGGFRDGDGMNGRNLANILKRYDIKSTTLRVDDKTPKGYRREMFEDAWSRYLPQDPPAKRNIRNIPENMGKTTPQHPQQEPSMLRMENDDFPDSAADVADVAERKGDTGEELVCSICDSPVHRETGLCLDRACDGVVGDGDAILERT